MNLTNEPPSWNVWECQYGVAWNTQGIPTLDLACLPYETMAMILDYFLIGYLGFVGLFFVYLYLCYLELKDLRKSPNVPKR